MGEKSEKLEAFLDFESHSLTLKYAMDVVKNCIACGFVMTAGWFTLSREASPFFIKSIGIAIAGLGLGLLCLNMIQLTMVGMKDWSKGKATIAVIGATVVAVILLYIGVSAFEMQVARLPR